MDAMLSSQILARFSVFHEGPRSFGTPSIRPGRWREKVPYQISSVITWPRVPRDWTRPTFSAVSGLARPQLSFMFVALGVK